MSAGDIPEQGPKPKFHILHEDEIPVQHTITRGITGTINGLRMTDGQIRDELIRLCRIMHCTNHMPLAEFKAAILQLPEPEDEGLAKHLRQLRLRIQRDHGVTEYASAVYQQEYLDK